MTSKLKLFVVSRLMKLLFNDSVIYILRCIQGSKKMVKQKTKIKQKFVKIKRIFVNH